MIPARDRGEPSARAIRERLVRIRNKVRDNDDAGHFSIGVYTRGPRDMSKKPGSASNVTTESASSTATATATNLTMKPQLRCGKRTQKSSGSTPVEQDGLASDLVTPTPTNKRKRMATLTNRNKRRATNVDDDDDDDDVRVKIPEAKRTKSQSMAWLDDDDWETVKKSPEGKVLFAKDEHEEDVEAKKDEHEEDMGMKKNEHEEDMEVKMDEHEEDMGAKKNFGGLDGGHDAEDDDDNDCIIIDD